jgi:hypothetical protein
MAFEPVGIAARRVVASLSVARQERKRAAENDNWPPPPKEPQREELREEARHRASPATTERTSPAEHRQAMSADVRGQ